jgi:PmbA protein
VALAQRAEAAAFAVDPRVTNTEGAGVLRAAVAVRRRPTRAASSAAIRISRHTLSVAPIAGKGAKMQRDDWYSSVRDANKMSSAGGDRALRRRARAGAPERAHASTPAPARCCSRRRWRQACLGAFVQATSGGALYRKSTFLLDSLGKQVLPKHVQIHEDPHVIGGVGSAPFDEEGVRTVKRDVVKDGVVQGYFLSTYSARKLGMKTTGNAGGSHNLSLTSSLTKKGDDFAAMLRKMGTGLLVTELMGQGTNYVTGDYSRGASGFWVENGVIQYPVEEITIAGNMKDMLAQIVAVGADVLVRGTKQTGSILIENMVVAGG